MQPEEIKAVLEQLILTVALLCDETALVVDDFSTRVHPDIAAEVRLKSDQIRVSGRLLRKVLDEVSREPGQ